MTKIDGVLHDFKTAPNPRRVRIYLAEKGLSVETNDINIMAREQKADGFVAKNPTGQIPVLELPDGTCISESVSICRYVEGLYPDPPLFGTTPLAQAQIDMWLRRIELKLMYTIGQVWVHGHELTKGLGLHNEFSADLGRKGAAAGYRLCNDALAGREFIAADSYSIADAVLLATVDFGSFVGVAYDPALTNLARWHETMSARPSAKA
ncbi:MAG: glutathione S-transferase family protein [Alphaproteobacteria bacterium]